jgi:fused signal recognition particle receptor
MNVGQAFRRMTEGLSKTRDSLVGRIQRLATGRASIDKDMLAQLEDILLSSDVGVEATNNLLAGLSDQLRRRGEIAPDELIAMLKSEMEKALTWETFDLLERIRNAPKPFVVMIVGVNGVGKTTTIGKLARRCSDAGLSVMIGAADTFRAAASEQLDVWAKRANVEMIRQKPGADPGAVAFDTVASAIAKKYDVVIIDTAGRLHTKVNLMEELRKIERVLEKRLPGAPHETFLVLDAGTGQNAIQQVRQFTEAVKVTGLVITKLDGTSKGGAVFAIRSAMEIPIRYIGVGEGEEDLHPFDGKNFVDALFEKSVAQSVTL